jgi:hypothetical protein
MNLKQHSIPTTRIGSEQHPLQPPEFINMEEIPSLDMTPGSPRSIVEETQQTTPMGMDIDVLEGGHGQKDEDAGNHLHPENPEASLRVNGTLLN